MKRALFVAVVFVVAACGGGDEAGPVPDSVTERVDEIAAQVRVWDEATTVEEATRAAEAAANLVVGPEGPGYGDRNGDGTIDGASDRGLLPGLDGEPAGVILDDLGALACVERDVLGGSWDDPQARWTEMTDAIAAWTPTNNTMPSLASHPMRVVGWATQTIDSADLDLAHEYAGHAQLHVDVTVNALDDCDT